MALCAIDAPYGATCSLTVLVAFLARGLHRHQAVVVMSWRAFMSRNVAEFRLICCPTSASGAAARYG